MAASAALTRTGKWLFILLSLLYLLGEAVFNSSLLDLVSRARADTDSLHRIELFGRALSSAGITLLVVSGIKALRRPPGRVVQTLAATGVFVLFFFGQKMALDAWVRHTDADTRAMAYAVNLLKTGLIRGYVRIEGLDSLSTDHPDAQDRTVLALIGLLAHSSPAFMETAERMQDVLIRRVVDSLSDDSLQQRYDDYLSLRERIVGAYRQYRQHADMLRGVEGGGRTEAARAWRTLNQKVVRGFDDLKRARVRFRERALEEARRHSPQLKRFFDRYLACKSKFCRTRVRQPYDRQMRRIFGREVPPEFWCEPIYDRKVLDVSGGHIRFDLGQLVGAVADGITGSRTVQGYDCSHAADPHSMQDRIIRLRADDFERKTGYPWTLTRLKDYLEHPTTQAKVRRELREQGIRVPAGWTLDDRAGFERAWLEYARTTGRHRWEKLSKKLFGQVLPLTLDYRRFVQHPAVQRQLKAALGPVYRPGMSLDMEGPAFREQVLKPFLEKSAARIRGWLTDRRNALAEGGAHAREGREAVRALMVPVVALFLSALVVLLTVAKLITLLLDPLWQRLPPGGRLPAKVGVTLALVVMLTLLIGRELPSDRATRYFLDQARAHAPLTWVVSNYLLRVQPVLAPWGDRLRQWLALLPPEEKREQVARWMQQAEQALARDRLMTPKGQSAFDYYRKVLALVPGWPPAVEGLKRIEARYETLVARAGSSSRGSAPILL